MSVTRHVFTADLHLTPQRPEGLAAFRTWLADVAAGADELHLMGDLFDYWIGPDHADLADYRAELAAIAGLTRRGVRTLLYKGNRDFWFGDRLPERLGVTVVSDHRIQQFGDARAYLCHGDLMCAGDHRYQAMRRVLRSGPVTAAAGAIPTAAKLWAARGARQISRQEMARKSAGSMDLCPRTLARIFSGRGDLAGPRRAVPTGPVDVVVCGHIHRPAERRYRLDAGDGRGPRELPVFVLGPWDAGPVWLEWTAATGFRLHGVADPTPVVMTA